MGITRKALLVYEDMGLLTPAVKDEESGYRYYSADTMTQIRSIRSLQVLGLSLKEVAEYYYDVENIDAHLERLMDLRASLDRNIQMLQVRAARCGDLTVHKTTLPQQICFCRQYQCADVSEAANKLRDTFIAAARTGKMSMVGRMFTMRMTQSLTIWISCAAFRWKIALTVPSAWNSPKLRRCVSITADLTRERFMPFVH